jgi:hypothetical protein
MYSFVPVRESGCSVMPNVGVERLAAAWWPGRAAQDEQQRCAARVPCRGESARTTG